MTTPDDRTANFLPTVKHLFEEMIPFNKELGIRIKVPQADKLSVHLEMKPELIGNFTLGVLHGGVISSVLDATGGLIAILGALEKLGLTTKEQIKEFLSNAGTIDLRIDYLRPGRGKRFCATGHVLRTGKRVAVTRMEFRNEEDLLIAVGTGTYIVG